MEERFVDLKKLSPPMLRFEPERSLRQYVGVVCHDRRYIYINAFDESFIASVKPIWPYFDWTKDPVVVDDGGKSFWNAWYDVKKGEFSHLCFNGEL